MKLYTENDVKKAMLIYHNGLTIDYVMSKLKHIELPSDDEIIEHLKGIGDNEHKLGFSRGTQWLINHIIQQVIS
jgi:hypothetical protein